MLSEERRRYILEQLQSQGRVLSSTLSAELGVSEDTIRRDLRDLARDGRLQRVHGGALPRSPEATYRARERQRPAAKQAIAQAAAALVQEEQIVIFDGGTTNLLVAQALPHSLRATVITNSAPIAAALAEHPLIEVIVLGGRLQKTSLAAVGPPTIEALRRVRADLCLLGVCSIHPEVGISTPDLEEGYVKEAMIASAAEVVALASHEKLGTAAPYVVAPLSELTHLITARGYPGPLLAQYRALGVTVVEA
jgi:DeoR/GlpR family transcriptional regulator of sugar metabolism